MTHGRPQKPRATLRLEQKRVPGSCHGLACQRGRRQGRPGVHRSSVLPRPRLILPLRSQVCSTFLLFELPGNPNDSWASQEEHTAAALTPGTREACGVRATPVPGRSLLFRGPSLPSEPPAGSLCLEVALAFSAHGSSHGRGWLRGALQEQRGTQTPVQTPVPRPAPMAPPLQLLPTT